MEKLNEQKVKLLFSRMVLNLIKYYDWTLSQIVRKIIFDSETSVNWDKVYKIIMQEIPELQLREEYKEENMK